MRHPNQVDFEKCQGRTVKKVHDIGWEYTVITFTDGTFSCIFAEKDGDDAADIYMYPYADLFGDKTVLCQHLCTNPQIAPVLLDAGILTQEEIDEALSNDRELKAAEELVSERHQYEQLKRKFEGEDVVKSTWSVVCPECGSTTVMARVVSFWYGANDSLDVCDLGEHTSLSDERRCEDCDAEWTVPLPDSTVGQV